MRHVLYFYDGPKMVLAVDGRGRQLLGVVADEDESGAARWVFAPAPPERVVSLLKTRTGLRALFESGMIEVHDVEASGTTSSRAWSLSPDEVPDDLLPDPDAELPELTDAARDALLIEQARYVDQRSRLARSKLLFNGRPVRAQRGISAAFAGEVLTDYQNLVALAYGHRKQGALSSTGPIPQRGGSALVLTDMPRGSVGFELVEDAEQERVVPTDLAEVVSEVGVLLDAAATSDAAYAEAVAEIDPRVVTTLGEFFGKLKKADATMKLEVQGKEYAFDGVRIAEAIDRTASAPRSEDDRPVEGTLAGFLPNDRRFELATATGVIKGKVARDADADAIRGCFGKPCVAHLHVVTIERLGQSAQAFTLLRVEPLTDPS